MIKGTVDVLDRWMESRMEGIHTSIPAKIETFDFATRKATILPLVNLRTAAGYILEMPAISGVPVIFPCAAGWSLVGPLSSGDTGLILISEVSLGNWLAGQGQQVDPEDETRFSLQDAIFLPGLYPYSAVPSQPGTENDLCLSTPKGSVTIKPDGTIAVSGQGKISLTNEASGMQAEIGKLWDAINDVLTKMSSLAPLTTAPGSPTSPNPAQVTLITQAITANTTSKQAVGQFLED